MTGFLPTGFAVLALLALVAALWLLWQSFRAALGAMPLEAAIPRFGAVERDALQQERTMLLESLRDLKFEWQVGKLSDEDYKQQEALIRKRTREVLRMLDADVGPYRDAARALFEKRQGGTEQGDGGAAA